ncbi:response regulator transcription factor [Nitrogeniibacter mangrovi]|uniref:Response regulator transcription factor n=1 Tax=Nitrogeniibacter mangrovi TaxID=2016596 RepID=A0A6C1B8E8_9RHOO|nr:response regulator transcription factor [Nitrogeniibacter mangrovi]
MLLDDHAIVRSGYRRLIDAEPDLEVVAEAADADEAYAAVKRCEPDVAVVDLSLRGASGIEAIRRILARKPELRILVVSMHDSANLVSQAFQAGATGYLTKCSDPGQMIEAIRGVSAGRRVMSPEVSHALACAALDSGDLSRQLTPREFEVLRLAVRGESTASIAAHMHLSQKTVLNYLSAVRQKLNAENDFSLLHLAARHGLVDMPASALN